MAFFVPKTYFWFVLTEQLELSSIVDSVCSCNMRNDQSKSVRSKAKYLEHCY